MPLSATRWSFHCPPERRAGMSDSMSSHRRSGDIRALHARDQIRGLHSVHLRRATKKAQSRHAPSNRAVRHDLAPSDKVIEVNEEVHAVDLAIVVPVGEGITRSESSEVGKEVHAVDLAIAVDVHWATIAGSD